MPPVSALISAPPVPAATLLGDGGWNDQQPRCWTMEGGMIILPPPVKISDEWLRSRRVAAPGPRFTGTSRCVC